jgi:hypothetical protein
MEQAWMSGFADKSTVRRLVQNGLGCGCPEDVFDHYVVSRRETRHGSFVQMVLGNRLLVWIFDVERVDTSSASIGEILLQGRMERDRRELNRFRLVLSGPVQDRHLEPLEKLPQLAYPKVHLHNITIFR